MPIYIIYSYQRFPAHRAVRFSCRKSHKRVQLISRINSVETRMGNHSNPVILGVVQGGFGTTVMINQVIGQWRLLFRTFLHSSTLSTPLSNMTYGSCIHIQPLGCRISYLLLIIQYHGDTSLVCLSRKEYCLPRIVERKRL